MSAPSVPLLRADSARIAVDGAVALDALTFSTHGERVVCVGDAHALVAALTGIPLDDRARVELDEPAPEADVTAGKLLLFGRDVAAGEQYSVMGVAPLDPPLPAAWTAHEYVTWNARMSGARAAQARELGAAALARAGLAASGRKRISALPLAERRALSLAGAAAASPAVLVAEAPLSGLDASGAAYVTAVLSELTRERGAIVSLGRMDASSPEGALARSATHIVVLSRGALVVDGPPTEVLAGASLYALTVRTHKDAFRAELAARGIDLRGGPRRFSLALPGGSTTRDVLAAAAAARAAVVELSPLF